MEIWNAYTADGQLTDHTLTRGEPIPTASTTWSSSASSATTTAAPSS